LRHNTERILVSHAGNLPRPDDLDELLAGGESKRHAFRDRLPSAVAEIVDRQIDCGIDIVNDGEYIKAGSYTGYMQERVSGWELKPIDPSRPPKRAGVAERDRRGSDRPHRGYSRAGSDVYRGKARRPPNLLITTQFASDPHISSGRRKLPASLLGLPWSHLPAR